MTLFKKLAFSFGLFLIFASCNSSKKDLAKQNEKISHQAEQRVIDFISWYLQNLNRLNEFPLLKKLPEGDSLSIYEIDFKAAGLFLNEIQKSGFVSKNYLDSLEIYFQEADKQFQFTRQNDGPPGGFEADLILGIQDFSDVVNNLDSPIIEKRDEENGIYTCTFSFPSQPNSISYSAILIKENEHWMLAQLKRK